jgi:hypothetical protein
LKKKCICRAVEKWPRVYFQRHSVSIFNGEKAPEVQYSTLKNEPQVNFQPGSKHFVTPDKNRSMTFNYIFFLITFRQNKFFSIMITLFIVHYFLIFLIDIRGLRLFSAMTAGFISPYGTPRKHFIVKIFIFWFIIQLSTLRVINHFLLFPW